MAYSIDVTVVEIRAGADPAGTLNTQVSFGYRIPIPMPPTDQGVPMPKPVVWQHALHIFIPKDKWLNQFSQWENYHLVVQDDGQIELKKAQ